MNARRIFQIASCLFLVVAASCVFLATEIPESGVRIPVHCANGKIGYIDGHGRMVIPPVWDTATPFGTDDRALVSIIKSPGRLESLFQRWILRSAGFPKTSHYRIDRQGNLTTTPPPFTDPLLLEAGSTGSGGMTLVQAGAEFRWILGDGRLAFPGGWQQAMDFRTGDPAAVFENGRWDFINRKGETVIPSRWDHTLGFNGNGRACVAIGRKWGVIDREERLVIPLRFKSLAGFDDANLCAAEMASGWGFIDPDGKIAVPFRYQKAEPFDRFGMAKVQLTVDGVKNLSGWIDRNGKSIVQPRYEVEAPVWAPNFTDHELLPVIESGKTGLIDRKGRTVVETAQGELKPVGDLIAPDDFWITTIPYRSSQSQNGKSRPPFQPTCFDSVGTLIWNGNDLPATTIYAMVAAISGLVSALLYIAGKRAVG